MTRCILPLVLAVAWASSTAAGQPTAPATSRSVDDRKLLEGVTTPAGFELTVFAKPPDVNYPTCVTATPRGEVFIGIDDQGSLGKDAGRGRIVRCIDRDNDGTTDEIKTFAKMDHPRGMEWDDAARALYILHPPLLSRYYDEDGDGVAERSETLVRGITNEKVQSQRGADHTTNGIRLGIDGWIYIAVGDFGFPEAVGSDGTRLQLRGGGIVRVRTDGSGLETYASGTRNIYDVGIDPLLNVFTRDNTNDGDGWNDRLTYSPPTAYHGYPSRYKRFKDETVDCMLDLGSGSPCGSLFVDEPGLPEGHSNVLYTVEWGRNVVDRHPLTLSGAGFKAETKQLMELPRGTDIDIDGLGRFYVTSWAGGKFAYNGPDVGYVIHLAPRGYQSPAFPDLRAADDVALLEHLAAPSAVRRQATQREILRRGDKATFADGLSRVATSDKPLSTRVLSVFTLSLLRGEHATATLIDLARRDDLREFALRALADGRRGDGASVAPFIDALRDPNPRVRLVAAWGLSRLGAREVVADILPLTADADPLVAHVATNALVSLRATDACLAAVNAADVKVAAGALGVLRQLHDEAAVNGLAAKLGQTREAATPALRTLILRTLCRLYWREAEWDGSWWGTRPDTSGPYFKPVAWSGTPRVAELIRRALADESPEVVRALLIDAAAHKIDLPEVQDALVKVVLNDSAIAAAFVETLAGRKRLGEREMKAIEEVIASDAIEPAVRAKGIRMLGEELDDAASVEAAVDALGRVASAEKPHAELSAALDSFLVHPQQFRQIKVFSQLAASGPAGRREVALAALINVAGSTLTKPEPRERAARAVDRAWEDPSQVAPLLRAIGRTKAKAYAERVRSKVKDADPAIAAAAAYAAGRLDEIAKAHETVLGLGYDTAAAAAAKLAGNPNRGKEVFAAQGCVACHTVSEAEPPKGPYLGGIATRYSRAELLESILKPSVKIAQGFDTQWFKTKDDVLEGFVTRESGEEIELRNLTGVATVLKKSDVKGRGKRDTSMMPTNLADPLSPDDLASLVAYLESLKAH